MTLLFWVLITLGAMALIKILACGKHPSLLCQSNNNKEKRYFIRLTPVSQCYKTFFLCHWWRQIS